MVAVQKKLLVDDKPLSPFAVDAIKGLRSTRKTIPPKYFYDAKGSDLFEQITEQPEYYPTRTELGILEENGAAIAAIIPQGAALVEFGSGASRKTRTLLRFAPQVAAYVPVEICPDMVREQARDLQREFSNLKVFPVEADFSAPFDLPADVEEMPKTGFFPGSTIGNFEPHQAASFLRQAARILGSNATFVIGFDLIKESEIINAAYNDAAGITAAFNMNILTRLNRDLGANFDLATFEHHAFFNRERNRVEMHLASSKRQKVRLLGETVEFRAGETIHTESSYKYSVDTFTALARGSGWSPVVNWMDADRRFCVIALKSE
jgi:dimethylhistidine N-methyltransferase